MFKNPKGMGELCRRGCAGQEKLLRALQCACVWSPAASGVWVRDKKAWTLITAESKFYCNMTDTIEHHQRPPPPHPRARASATWRSHSCACGHRQNRGGGEAPARDDLDSGGFDAPSPPQQPSPLKEPILSSRTPKQLRIPPFL